jgi:hypothetical protein
MVSYKYFMESCKIKKDLVHLSEDHRELVLREILRDFLINLLFWNILITEIKLIITRI